MKNLFLLDGVAGTGKSDCIKYIRDHYNGRFRAGVIQKYTTRARREEEKKEDHKVDLEFVSTEEFKQIRQETLQTEGINSFFYYRYGDDKYGYHEYGVRKSDIDKALGEYQDVFLIVRNVLCINSIISAYKGTAVNVVPVFIYTDPSKVIERLRHENYSEEAINFRTSRSNQVWNEYLAQAVPLYKDIIINNSNPTDFHKFIDQLMMKYDQEERMDNPSTMVFPCGDIAHLSASLVGHRKALDQFLNYYAYEKNIFLMIKYRENNLELRNELKDRIERKGFHCVIANETNLTNDIYNPIALTYCCKYGIAIFDEPEEGNVYSPNVAYELGIMQSQAKKCLVVKHHLLADKKFFDILKDEGNLYTTQIQLCKTVDGFLSSIMD